MELWIRSQDRKILTQVKELYVTTYAEEEGYGIYDLPDEVDDTDVPLGFYKSKERALKVLDEIHQRLIDLQTIEIEPSFYKIATRCLDIVYIMPKE